MIYPLFKQEHPPQVFSLNMCGCWAGKKEKKSNINMSVKNAHKHAETQQSHGNSLRNGSHSMCFLSLGGIFITAREL